MDSDRRLSLSVVIPMATLIACLAVATVWLCGGHLVYNLDDPYITLSLGWHIGHGHYGINSGEAASPSSSILYPFLLACFAWTPRQDWIPLVVNSTAALGTATLLAIIAGDAGLATAPGRPVRRTTLLLLTMCLAFNLAGLVFTGLEHSLHTLTSLAVVLGLVRVLEGKPTPGWLIAAIVLAPLWRFEGIALAMLAIAVLGIERRPRAGLTALSTIVVCLSAYMLIMSRLGLPLLPSSVLVKQQVIANGTSGGGLAAAEHALNNLLGGPGRYPPALVLLLFLALVVAHPILRASGYSGLEGQYRLSLRGEFILAAAWMPTRPN